MDNGALIEILKSGRSLCRELKLQIINDSSGSTPRCIHYTSERFNIIGKCAAFEYSTMQLYRKI